MIKRITTHAFIACITANCSLATQQQDQNTPDALRSYARKLVPLYTEAQKSEIREILIAGKLQAPARLVPMIPDMALSRFYLFTALQKENRFRESFYFDQVNQMGHILLNARYFETNWTTNGERVRKTTYLVKMLLKTLQIVSNRWGLVISKNEQIFLFTRTSVFLAIVSRNIT